MDSHRARSFAARAAGIAALLVGSVPVAAEVSITPRVAVYFDNLTQRQSATNFNTPGAQQLVDQVNTLARQLGATFSSTPSSNARNSSQLAFPQFGGAVTFGWRDSETTQIALSALYGRTTASDTTIVQQFFNYGLAGVNVQDTLLNTTRRQGEFSRLDLEATVQHRLNETFSLIGGLRAERTDSDFDRTSNGGLSLNFFNLYFNLTGVPPIYQLAPAPSRATEGIRSMLYSARFGAAAYAPVGEKHLFYVNGLVQLSHNPDADYKTTFPDGSTLRQSLPGETTLGPDISVGYMYRMSDRYGIDIRYRATVYFTIDGPSAIKDARINHGLSVGFTSWLGSR